MFVGSVRAVLVVALSLAATALPAIGASGAEPPDYEFTTPVFGLAATPDGGLVAADTGSGVIQLRKGSGSPIAELPGVTDVAPIGTGGMWALTTAPDGRLYSVSRGGKTRPVAEISAFEEAENPDGGEIDSNPFDLAALGGGSVLVADAAANAVLIADRTGYVDWVATLPEEVVPSDHAKDVAGCPNPPAELAFVCGLPDSMPAQPVTTSVAVGPDGAYYVSELKGFPAPLGKSQVWRIEPGTRHAECGSSPACEVIADGFTSIVDINFGPDGTLYVVELDENSWLGLEVDPPQMLGGTINACTWDTFDCTEQATGLPIPMAVAITGSNHAYAAIWALVPGEARIIAI